MVITLARHGDPREIIGDEAVDRARRVRADKSNLAHVAHVEEADLLSYLLFDSSYTAVIEDLGYQDAKAKETAIIAFLEDVFKASGS